MNEVIDIKRQNREALHWILNIDELKTSYINSMSEFSAIGAAVNDGMPRGTDISRPCQNKAISLIELKRKETWILAIELMEKTLSEKSKKYLELRRDAEAEHKKAQKRGFHKRGRPGWVDYVQPRYAEWFYKRYGKATIPDWDKMSEWMNRIVDIATGIAIGKGIF